MRKFALLMVVLLLAPGCSRKAQELFPEQASGWVRQGATRNYTAETLYEYIDGDAEKYVQAGVKTTQTADYKYQGQYEAVVDVFTMGSGEGAQKVFESQPDVGSKAVQIGDAARVYSGSVTFRRGPYFVRLVAYDAQAGDALLELARAVESRLTH